MAFSIAELDLQSATVLPARQTMRRGDGGFLNGNLNTTSGDIHVWAFNGAQANVYHGAGNGNSAQAAQSIVIEPQTSGGVYLALPF